MEKIKSAFELALEKTASEKNMEEPDKEKEEIKEAEVGKYLKAAAVLGRSFLQGKSKKEEILEAFGRYPDEAREKAEETFLEEITAGMNLDNAPEILEAITSLKKNEEAQKTCSDLQHCYESYRAELQEQLKELQKNAGSVMLQMLEQRGISGSAISGYNVKKLEQYEEITSQIEKKYMNAVEDFRYLLQK